MHARGRLFFYASICIRQQVVLSNVWRKSVVFCQCNQYSHVLHYQVTQRIMLSKEAKRTFLAPSRMILTFFSLGIILLDHKGCLCKFSNSYLVWKCSGTKLAACVSIASFVFVLVRFWLGLGQVWVRFGLGLGQVGQSIH